MLVVTDEHRLYWEMCGAPNGIAALYLHGGPGGGCIPEARRNFDPRCATWAGHAHVIGAGVAPDLSYRAPKCN